MQIKGFINVFKPLNMTSSDVVVKVRGMLRRATGEKQKVGHLGTLDPLAVGVLPIAVGNATRLFDYMQDKRKTYITTFKFGTTTDTIDRGGKIIDTCDKEVSESDVIRVLPNLIGEISQMPPQYSAKSINGKKAYEIAREGGVADLKPKKVTIYDIKLLGAPGANIKLSQATFADSFDAPMKSDLTTDTACINYALSNNEFAFEITCGSGTYI
ncbi:MAG: tRNA pseudouridine(55) synthase TruB, partial [Clostridia bacterium]|nr:tRNA pseudouridine(55) synthase TruB [Clostridia bacterium]